jgi:hypothetical protein
MLIARVQQSTLDINRKLFGVGLLIYVTSFFLVGASGPGSQLAQSDPRGYFWAFWALVLPWTEIDLWTRGAGPFLMPATVIVGLINPVFLLAVVSLVKERDRLFSALKFSVFLMLPFCLVHFLLFRFFPREGFVFWTTGMLLVLFSGQPQQ